MYLMPLPFLLGTLAGLLSVALLVGGAYIVWQWYIGELATMAWLATGVGMLLWSALGRFMVLALYPRGSDEPHPVHHGPARIIQGPDGSRLYVEVEGDPDKPLAILTHGWALDSTAWYYIRKHLSPHYRLLLWDLPGLGRSTPPTDSRYTMTRLAEDLRRIIDEFGNSPVTLVGHSIGGMMILTLCRDVTRGQLEFATRFNVKDKPSVVAKGLLAVLRWDETDTPPSISVPTLVITGDADRITLPEAGIGMSKLIPGAELIRIKSAGHNGLLEEGRQYSDAIAGLLKRATGALRSHPRPVG